MKGTPTANVCRGRSPSFHACVDEDIFSEGYNRERLSRTDFIFLKRSVVLTTANV